MGRPVCKQTREPWQDMEINNFMDSPPDSKRRIIFRCNTMNSAAFLK
jgi:hypothetical protein